MTPLSPRHLPSPPSVPLSPARRPRRRHARHRGQSLVEFALISPLLFFLAFGMVDLGRAIYYENALTNAAREGARIAILSDNPCNTEYGESSTTNCGTPTGTGTTVCGAVKAQAGMIGSWSCTDGGVLPATGTADTAYVQVDQYSASTTPCTGTASQTTPRSSGNLPISVTVRYYYRPLTPLLSNLFPSTFYIASTSCVRPEY